MPARRYLVSGRVQGVGYRFFVCAAADLCGVHGFVRNLMDGRVEVVAEGDAEALEALRVELEQGPPAARVGSVSSKEVSSSVPYSSFVIRG